VWIYVDVTLDALLPCVRPAVTTHPFAFTQRAFELAKASFLPLIWRETLAFWSGLWAILDIVAFTEAQMAQVALWGTFELFSLLLKKQGVL